MVNNENIENGEEREFFTVNQEYLDAEKEKELLDTNDYFTHIRDEDLATYFKQLLYCRTKLIQYEYPNELTDEEGAFGEHLMRCNYIFQNKLNAVLFNVRDEENNGLSNEIVIIKANQKYRELRPLLDPIIDKYREEYEVEYIILDTELIFIPDFDGDKPYNENEDD